MHPINLEMLVRAYEQDRLAEARRLRLLYLAKKKTNANDPEAPIGLRRCFNPGRYEVENAQRKRLLIRYRGYKLKVRHRFISFPTA